MAFIYYNPNPKGKSAYDCTVRALSAITSRNWRGAYLELCAAGELECSMPSEADSVDRVLTNRGYRKAFCEGCRSIAEFAKKHPVGKFVLMTGTHMVAVIDGDYYDALDTGNEVPIYFWY